MHAFVPTRSHHLLGRLQHEWLRLDRSPELVARARDWQLPVAPFDSLDELVGHCGRGATTSGSHDDDAVLGALLRLARHDELAARVLLQRMLPVLAAFTRSAPSHHAQQEALHELLAASWTVIRTYPLHREPWYVAADLTRRIRYVAFGRDRRRVDRSEPQPWWVFDLELAPDEPVAPAVELAELLDDARRGGVDLADLELARRLGRGETPAALAAERRVTDRTMRNRRAEVVHRLRAVALASA
ncbi:MAG: hypothetical protein U0Q03_20640 [Acidimicrobiales bacterium]